MLLTNRQGAPRTGRRWWLAAAGSLLALAVCISGIGLQAQERDRIILFAIPGQAGKIMVVKPANQPNFDLLFELATDARPVLQKLGKDGAGKIVILSDGRALPPLDSKDLPKRIDELEEHHRDRLGEMMRAIASGAATAWEVARTVSWAPGPFDDFSTWQKRAALTETAAHLEYMRSRGMLAAGDKHGIVVYSRLD